MFITTYEQSCILGDNAMAEKINGTVSDKQIDKQTEKLDSFLHVHEDVVNAVEERMPDEELLYDLAELYKIFGDTTRIRILYTLMEAEICVGDIASILNM